MMYGMIFILYVSASSPKRDWGISTKTTQGTMNSLWINFMAMVTCQVVIFFAFAKVRRLSLHHVSIIIGPSLVFGLPFGLMFDLIIDCGASIFQYFLGQDITFLALNGLLSYGVAVATAARFPREVIRRRSQRLSRSDLAIILAAAILIGAGLLALRISGPLLEMFWAGTIVITFGEITALLAGWFGPVARLLRGEFRPFCSYWINSMVLGSMYELVNSSFPVWHWTLARSIPNWSVELFVIAFGYFVLFHPITLTWQLLLNKLIHGRAEKLVKSRNQLNRIGKNDDS
jgi:hypothetical protein